MRSFGDSANDSSDIEYEFFESLDALEALVLLDINDNNNLYSREYAFLGTSNKYFCRCTDEE